MHRRTALEMLLAASLPAAACRSSAPPESMTEMNTPPPSTRMPVVFLAHGSPLLLDDAGWVAELGAWAQKMPRPRAILMISAHWVDAPLTLSSTDPVPLVYDFYNFPEPYYQITYPAPPAPALARRVRELLGGTRTVASAPTRGLDHGAYLPLIAMYPEADIPVLQMSLPSLDPAPLLALGQKLAPLRDEGVLLVGSGFLTHNLRDFRRGPMPTPPAWASEFDAWCADVLARRDADALVDYQARAPGVREALPTHEHFVPVLATLGASMDLAEPAQFPITGFTYGSFTRRSVQYG